MLQDNFGQRGWINKSVPSDMPAETRSDQLLQQELSKRIRDSDVVIMFTNVAASRRHWIDKEIGIARYWQIPIISLKPHDMTREARIVIDAASANASWRGNSIATAIKEVLEIG
jgi:MTH538 TIR-like domain (DUF1863)